MRVLFTDASFGWIGGRGLAILPRLRRGVTSCILGNSNYRRLLGGNMADRLEPYRVEAYNTAKTSENKMHDDAVARKFGFSGGLVPGVDVMAYMMHLPVELWGRAFLERGLIEVRFVKPVYDGEAAEVTPEDACGGLAIRVESRGQLCATGTAALPASAPVVSVANLHHTAT